jgi:hypothetical protein
MKTKIIALLLLAFALWCSGVFAHEPPEGFVEWRFLIPVASEQSIITGLSKNGNYKPTVENESGGVVPNPVSKKKFAKQQVRNFMRKSPESYQIKTGIKARRNEIRNRVRTEMEDVVIATGD